MGAAIPKVVEAEKFILRDASGTERGEMFATEAARGIVFFNKNGERGVALVVSDQMNALMISDRERKSSTDDDHRDGQAGRSECDEGRWIRPRQQKIEHLSNDGRDVGWRSYCLYKSHSSFTVFGPCP